MKEKGFAPIMIILLISVIGGVVYFFTTNKNNSRIPSSTNVELSPYPSNTPLPPNKPVKKVGSTDTTFPHELLPEFNINIPNGWSTLFKQFNESTNNKFTSIYKPACDERCMGVLLTKNDVSLELTFDVAFDSNAFRCSNSATNQQLSGGWYQIKNSSGYFYTRNVELNKTLEKGRYPAPVGQINDEWSAVDNTTYKICVIGSGSFLSQRSPVEDTDGPGTKAPILLEHPRIIGNPTKEQLKEIDTIVTSMSGVGH